MRWRFQALGHMRRVAWAAAGTAVDTGAGRPQKKGVR